MWQCTLAPAVSTTGASLAIRRYAAWQPAAFVGGLCYGFGPFLATDLRFGHLNLTFLAIPPLILLALDDLFVRRKPAGARRGCGPSVGCRRPVLRLDRAARRQCHRRVRRPRGAGGELSAPGTPGPPGGRTRTARRLRHRLGGARLPGLVRRGGAEAHHRPRLPGHRQPDLHARRSVVRSSPPVSQSSSTSSPACRWRSSSTACTRETSERSPAGLRRPAAPLAGPRGRASARIRGSAALTRLRVGSGRDAHPPSAGSLWPYAVRRVAEPQLFRARPLWRSSGQRPPPVPARLVDDDPLIWQALGGVGYELSDGYAIVPGPGGHATEELVVAPGARDSAKVVSILTSALGRPTGVPAAPPLDDRGQRGVTGTACTGPVLS